MTDLQLVTELRSQDPELEDFSNFTKLPEKYKLPDKTGLEPTEMKRKEDSGPLPGQTPFIN